MTSVAHAIQEVLEIKPNCKLVVVNPHNALVMDTIAHASALGLIEPVLVGNKKLIHDLMGKVSFLDNYTVIDCSSNPEILACQLVRSGEGDILMKGDLHSDTFLSALITQKLVQKGKLITHIAVIMVPNGRELFITDPSVFIDPDLRQKEKIINNAIDLLHYLDYEVPKVAILSSVESPTERIKSSVDAAALTQLFVGRIDCEVFGPLGLDIAVSDEASRIKSIPSGVAGIADVLIVPNLDSGNLMTKALVYIAKMETISVLAGTSKPVVFTSRSASEKERLNSIAFAAYQHFRNKTNTV